MGHYLIRYHKEKVIVSAKTSLEAVTHWVKTEQEVRENEGRKVKFNPSEFSVELVGGILESEKDN